MFYRQKVKLKNIDFRKVTAAFHDFRFVKFLTYLQPVKIIKWTGIKDGDTAEFEVWFFGWKKLFVTHQNYKKTNCTLSFTDYADSSFPFGVAVWSHTHEVRIEAETICIVDDVKFTHKNRYLGILVYPILVAPIFIRKISYRLFFYKNYFID